MTVELNPERQCRGKATYASKQEAKAALRRTQTSLGRDLLGPHPLKAYRCPHGDHYHFGHFTPELRERLRQAEEL